MTSDGFGEMFEGDFADMCAEFFLLMQMGERAGPGARTLIVVSGNYCHKPFIMENFGSC